MSSKQSSSTAQKMATSPSLPPTQREPDLRSASLVSIEMSGNSKDLPRSNTRNRRNNVHGSDIYILGNAYDFDETLAWRVKVGQCGAAIFAPLSLICYMLGGGYHFGFRLASVIFCVIALTFWGTLFVKNTSWVMIQRLLKEPKVIILVMLTFSNLIIDCYEARTVLTPFMSCLYLLVINTFVFVDAVVRKSRFLLLGVGALVVILGTYNVYGTTFSNWDKGVVLLQYAIGDRKYTIMKRSTQRSIHLQILLFSARAVYTTFSDKKMELMVFGIGQIHRDQIDNRTKSRSANARIRWSQYGAFFFTLIGVSCYVFGGMRIFALQVVTLISSVLALICCTILFYKNFSLPIFKKLLKEINVLVIIVLTIWNFIVVTMIPRTPLSPFIGFIYFLVTCAFLFLDAVVQKSRAMAAMVGLLFVALNLYNLYGSTISDFDDGIILFRYTLEGVEYTIMKRSTHQGIYLQILLFSSRAVYRLLFDKKMELMVFGTSNIYRKSGTTAEHIEDKAFTAGLGEENSLKWVRTV